MQKIVIYPSGNPDGYIIYDHRQSLREENGVEQTTEEVPKADKKTKFSIN